MLPHAQTSRIHTQFGVICAATAGALLVLLASLLSDSLTGHFFSSPPPMLVNGAGAAILVTSLTAFVCWMSDVTSLRGRLVNGSFAAMVLYAAPVIATGGEFALLALALAAAFGTVCGAAYHYGRQFAERSY
jgi:hypothetical protein